MEGTDKGTSGLCIKKVSKARIQLISQFPFFGRLAMQLYVEETDRLTQTMGTDGENLYFNPNFVSEITLEELKGVVAHEALHCALGHIWRKKSREPERWNFAVDYATNIILRDNKLTLPQGALYDDKYRNMSAEQIYEKLPMMSMTMAMKSASGSGEGDDKKDGKGSGEQKQKDKINDSHKNWGKVNAKPEMQKQMEAKWAGALEDATNEAKSQGHEPAGMEREVRETKSQEDWTQILSQWLSVSYNDYNFSVRDRRFLDADFYLPGTLDEMNIENIVIAVDTSGSIGEQEINDFIGHMKQITKSFPKVTGWVMDCDARVHSVRKLEEIMTMTKPKFKGGGGTSHEPVFAEIKKMGITPKVVLCFTDLYTDFPSKAPDYPVLWLVQKNGSSSKAPFGRTIHLRDSLKL